jgi:hypothetical protein
MVVRRNFPIKTEWKLLCFKKGLSPISETCIALTCRPNFFNCSFWKSIGKFPKETTSRLGIGERKDRAHFWVHLDESTQRPLS